MFFKNQGQKLTGALGRYVPEDSEIASELKNEGAAAFCHGHFLTLGYKEVSHCLSNRMPACKFACSEIMATPRHLLVRIIYLVFYLKSSSNEVQPNSSCRWRCAVGAHHYCPMKVQNNSFSLNKKNRDCPPVKNDSISSFTKCPKTTRSHSNDKAL